MAGVYDDVIAEDEKLCGDALNNLREVLRRPGPAGAAGEKGIACEQVLCKRKAGRAGRMAGGGYGFQCDRARPYLISVTQQ
jgi:hypothetical protein